MNEIPEDKDKLSFLISIIDKQFLDEDPKELPFISKLCYESQRHAIESSVKGWKRANKTEVMGDPITDPTTNPTTKVVTNPKEEEEKVEEKEQYNSKEIAGVVYDLTSVEEHKEYYNVLIKNMNKEHTWLESLYRNEKISKGKLGKLVDLFIIHLMSKEVKDRPDTLSKFKQHCAAWIRLKFRMGDFQEYSSIKPKGSI
jgi:hypothetical protein